MIHPDDENNSFIPKDKNLDFYLRDRVRKLLSLNIWNSMTDPVLFEIFENIHEEAIEIENPDINDMVVRNRLELYASEVEKKTNHKRRTLLSPSDKLKQVELKEHLKLIWFILQ